MQKVRNHLVNFRVSDEELEQIKCACDRQGARCLSHFVREVMLSSPKVDPENVLTKVVNLDRRVTALEDRLPSDLPCVKGKEVPPCV
jgi:hypothetical protein